MELELACQRAVVEGDAATLHRLLAESGFLPEPERVDPEQPAGVHQGRDLVVHDGRRTVQLTPEIATQVMIESSDPRSSHFRQMRHQDMRPEHLFGRRMEMLTLAVLSPAARPGQLAPDRPRVDVRRRARHRAGPPGGRVLRDAGVGAAG